MAILEREVEIKMRGKSIKHYQELGYEIPRKLNAKGELTVDQYAKINVKVEHLSKNSHLKVTKICDECGSVSNNIYYRYVIESREKGDGKDRCRGCGWKRGASIKSSNYMNNGNSINETDPYLTELFYDKEDAFKYSRSSGKKTFFKCPNCENKMLKSVGDVYYYGLSCNICDDGFKYPEKFMKNTLTQLGIDFETEKTFEWSEGKRYDFYIVEYNIIIETHGQQHYDGGFKVFGGNSLKEEQDNDEFKLKKAIEKGVKKYIVIDCRKSELQHIKNSILDSELAIIYNLSIVNLELSHKAACSSLAHESWKMFQGGITDLNKIAIKLNINKDTVRKYLKQGTEVNMCDYEAELNIRKIVQLSLSMEYIGEFGSISEAIFSLGKTTKTSVSAISSACVGRQNTAFGYKWMYKKDYDKYLNGELKLKEDTDPRFKSVVQLSVEGKYISEYDSVKSATMTFRGKSTLSNISSALKKIQETAYGYKWMYKSDYERYLNGEILTKEDKYPKIRQVVKLSLDNEFIESFDSVKSASLSVGTTNSKNISKVLSKKNKTAYGFKWLYKEEYER